MSRAPTAVEPYRNASLFSGHYLDERVSDLDAWDCDGSALEAFEALRERWHAERDLVAAYNEEGLLGSWIDEVLDVLGFDALPETTLPGGDGFTDRLLFDSAETRRDAAGRKKAGDTAAMYGLAGAVLEAKQWDESFSKRFSEHRSYRDASHQIKYYLERTPEDLRWGVLTNGRKWRLYGTREYATEVFYEIDLPELLESGDLAAFKYFYAFFRPEAFREAAGTSFLDRVWSESETAAQELGADLQDNVFTALRVLGEGFVETNDLDTDPNDAAARTHLKEQSLVCLYRLMFVLYAESRDLIHPDDAKARAEYENNFSLERMRSEIHDRIDAGERFEDFSEHSTQLWGRLRDLFRLVDEGEESLGVPAYNGGLFDADAHGFLADHEVADRYIAEVVYRIGTTEHEDGSFVLADYADLDTRHLGSIYEGLLEHEFRIAPEPYAAVSTEGGQRWKPASGVSEAETVETVAEGDLYVVNDDGERKATGSYYTPDHVVAAIVEETVDPLIAEIKADLAADGLAPSDTEYFRRFWQRVLELRILDPAMGSGHFLTKATGYLTEHVMAVVRRQEIQSYDEQQLRRDIAKECIYGVDVNGMAVELAKLSMWLETLAADQPLAFLDHHLKTGNSLVGSAITDVLSDGGEESGQLTLTQAFARTRRRTLDHVMDRTRELLDIDNDTLADVKSMEDIYDEIRADPLYVRLFELTNVHTAERFGLDVPDDADERMAGAIENDREWAAIREGEDWFASAQAMAEEAGFFHWELEFPAVFFDTDGDEREDAGFDAVIGNPPYGAAIDDRDERYYRTEYQHQDYQLDTYLLFLERGVGITASDGLFGMIVPNTWLSTLRFERIRRFVLGETRLRSIRYYRSAVFAGVTVDTLTVVLRNGREPADNEISVTVVDGESTRSHEVPQRRWADRDGAPINVFESTETRRVSAGVESGTTIDDHCAITQGAKPFQVGKGDPPQTREIVDTKPFVSERQESEQFRPLLSGSDIHRYVTRWDGDNWIRLGDWLAEPRYSANYDAPEKIVIRQTADSLIATLDREQFVIRDNLYTVQPSGIPATVVLGILNSTLLNWYYQRVLNPEKGEALAQVKRGHIAQLPLPADIASAAADSPPEPDRGRLSQYDRADLYALLADRVEHMLDRQAKRSALNLSLRDHLGSYADGQPLAAVGLTQPPEGSADSVLRQTATERPNLRIGEATVARQSEHTVEIRVTARYKPDDADAQETDRWGYTETEPLPAARITDLTATEADLIEAFVPLAVDEAGGFANFRETATKTNSLLDRLRDLTLPAVADVADGLDGYLQTRTRAEELDESIERTDELIDAVVYELYGLTEEEIEIVEGAVE